MRDTSPMQTPHIDSPPSSPDLLTFDSETKADIFAAKHGIVAWPHHVGCGRYALVYWDDKVRSMVGLISECEAKTLPEW